MKGHAIRTFLRLIALLLILGAAGLAWLQLPGYRRAAGLFPAGEVIAGVPVGGLDRAQAGERLKAVYSLPVEVRYEEALFQVRPEDLGFRVEVDPMLQAAGEGLQLSFWDYLWGRLPAPGETPLQASLDPQAAAAYLSREVLPRYAEPAVPAMPIPGGEAFQPGRTGRTLDLSSAASRLEAALRSPTERTAVLASQKISPPRPELRHLQVMLQQILSVSGYHGLAEVYVADLQTDERLDFAVQEGQAVEPGVAFTAASTIKIPVMISVFRRSPDPVPEDILLLVRQMIEASDNPSTDRVVQAAIDPVRGPLEVTADIQALGLRNTFWAGYFYDGAALLDRFETPASQRTDINTQPDLYNQTTAADMGGLLADLYRCAESGSGRLIEVFPGGLTQAKCRQMVETLRGNLLPVLIKAGVPEGTQIGHKHGWVQGPDGLLHVIADAGLVYSPGGNYVMAVYLYQPSQLLFDPANVLVAKLSGAVYNYFNIETSE